MDNQRNVLSVDFANNPDLKALISGWSVGEEYELNLKLQLNEMTPDGAKFSIMEVTSDEGEPEKPITPAGDTSPVMMVMSSGPSGNKEPYVAP